MRNRYLCHVFEEMRKAHETRNFSYLPGLVEEAQCMGNRMEAALDDKKDLSRYARKVSELKAEKKELEGKLKDLRSMVEGMEDAIESLKKTKAQLVKEIRANSPYEKTGQVVDEDV